MPLILMRVPFDGLELVSKLKAVGVQQYVVYVLPEAYEADVLKAVDKLIDDATGTPCTVKGS